VATPTAEDRLAIDRAKLAIDRDRLELDKSRVAFEQRDWWRRFPVMVAASGPITALILGVCQMRVARIGQDMQREQSDAARQQQQAQAALDWNLRVATLLAQHQPELYAADTVDRQRFKNILEVAYPPKIVDGVYAKLFNKADRPAAKRVWGVARADLQRAAIAASSPGVAPSGTIVPEPADARYAGSLDSTFAEVYVGGTASAVTDRSARRTAVEFESVDVWYAPLARASDPKAAKYLGRAQPNTSVGGWLQLGYYAVWLCEQRTTRSVSDTVRLNVRIIPGNGPGTTPEVNVSRTRE
jgi:hypothetical protein